MVAIKKSHQTRPDFEWRFQRSYNDRKNLKPLKNFAGFIFVCSNETIPDVKRKIFGLPSYHAESVRAIKQGMPLFLYNYSTRCLCGVYEAASDGGFNIDPHAWENYEVTRLGKPVSRYPAQVKVRVRFERSPLHEDSFRPILDHFDGQKFRLELTANQTQQLLRLFQVPERDFFPQRTTRRSYITSTVFPDSPCSSTISDSDCCSERSSKGLYICEDDSTDNARFEGILRDTVASYRNENNKQVLDTAMFSQMTLNDEPVNSDQIAQGEDIVYDPVSFSMGPCALDDRNMLGLNQHSSWMDHVNLSSFQCVDETDCRNEIQLLAGLQDGDPSADNNSVALMQQPPVVESDDAGVPTEPPHLPSFLPHFHNIIYIPIPRQQLDIGQLQNLKNGELQAPAYFKQELKPNNCGKVRGAKYQKPSGFVESNGYQPSPPLFGVQFGPPTVPYDQMPHMVYGCADDTAPLTTYTQLELDAVEESREGHAMIAPGYSNDPQCLFPANHFPIVLMPPAPYMIPRIPVGPQPMTASLAKALHNDILQFAKLTRPSCVRQLCVEEAIDCVLSCVKIVWPDADVEVFGSFATGLCLQHSDVDLAIVGIPMQPSLVNMSTSQKSAFLIQELAPFLKNKEWCKSYRVLATASVPVLKCFCRPLVGSDPSMSVAVDITIGSIVSKGGECDKRYHIDNSRKVSGSQKHGTQHTGSAAREYVLTKIQELPALAPLVLLMKSFLHHRGLSNVYLGGLGSFSLTLLVTCFLERMEFIADGLSAKGESASPDVSEFSEGSAPKSRCTNSALPDSELSHPQGKDYVRRAAEGIEKVLSQWESCSMPLLGTLLLGFLGTFGFHIDLSCHKIVLKGSDGGPGGIFRRENSHIALWIDDPLRPGINVGAGSFAMCRVQEAFREMWQVLTKNHFSVPSLCCTDGDCDDILALQGLPHLSQLLMLEAIY